MAFNLDTSLDAAEAAIRAHAPAPRARRLDADDLLCDLLHWIEAQGEDVEAALTNARRNWSDERSVAIAKVEV